MAAVAVGTGGIDGLEALVACHVGVPVGRETGDHKLLTRKAQEVGLGICQGTRLIGGGNKGVWIMGALHHDLVSIVEHPWSVLELKAAGGLLHRSPGESAPGHRAGCSHLTSDEGSCGASVTRARWHGDRRQA